jgi:hypothetical protein
LTETVEMKEKIINDITAEREMIIQRAFNAEKVL